MSGTSGVNLGMPLTFGKPEVDEKTGAVRLQGKIAGVDVQETVDALSKAMKAELLARQSKIDAYNKKLTALSTLESKVTALQDTASNLRGAREGSQAAGVFSKFLYTIPNAASTNDISVTIGEIIDEQNFKFQVQQLAQKDIVSSITGIPDIKVDLGWTGDLTIGTYTLSVDGKSAEAIRDEINANVSTTKATAQLINSADGYHFMIQSSDYAVPMTLTNNVTGANGQLPQSSTQSVDDLSAKYSYNGLQLTSTSNTITNIPNLTIDLQNVSSAEFNVTISHDREAVASAIIGFVNSYNALQDEISAHMAMKSDGMGKAEDAILFGNQILNTLGLQMGLAVASAVDGLSGDAPKSLGELGVALGGNDTVSGSTKKLPYTKLGVDTQQLYDSINKNFDDVKKIFAFDAKLSDSTFRVVKHPTTWPNELAENHITINVSRDNTGALSVTFTHDGQGDSTVYNGTINDYGTGATIYGPKGSPYENLNLIVVDTALILNGGSRQTTLNATQGVADSIMGIASTITKDTTGDFATQKSAIEDDKAKLAQAITRIEKRIEVKRDMLLASFQKMQEVVNNFLTMQNSLNVLLNPGGN